MSRRARTVPALGIVILAASGTAQAETKASARLSLEGGYGSNPYLASGSGQSTASGTARVEPTVEITSPTSAITLSGSLEHVAYSRYFTDVTNWSVGASAQIVMSPRSSLGLNASYSDRTQTAGNSITATPPDETDPLPDPVTNEVVGRRLKNLSGGVSFNTSLSARDSISLGINGRDIGYSGNLSTDTGYQAYGANAGYNHVVNSRLTVGAQIGYSNVDHGTTQFDQSRQITPSAVVSYQPTSRTVLRVNAGLSFTEISTPLGKINRTNFSGSLSFCHAGDRGRVCASASRGVSSTIQTGTSTITSAGLTYSYRLTPRSSFNTGVSYTDSQSISGIGHARTTYLVARAAYSRQLMERLTFGVNARYSNPINSTISRSEGFYGGLSISYRLGR